MYFTFKSVTSTDKGIILQEMDWFKKPQRRSEQTLIEGKDGATTTEYGYAPLVIPATIGLTDMTKLDEVMALLDGSGVLTYSGDTGKYRNAKVLEQVDYQRLLRFKTAEAQFLIEDPFRYVTSEADQTITTFPATIANAGTVLSLPLLKITGTGTVNLTLNGITFEYIFDTAYVYIDCDSQEAYYGTTSKNRSLTITGDDYMTLAIGNNSLVVNSGTVTQVLVTKRTRYL